VTGVETLAMAADLADDDELETSAYYKYIHILLTYIL